MTLASYKHNAYLDSVHTTVNGDSYPFANFKLSTPKYLRVDGSLQRIKISFYKRKAHDNHH